MNRVCFGGCLEEVDDVKLGGLGSWQGFLVASPLPVPHGFAAAGLVSVGLTLRVLRSMVGLVAI